MKAMTDSRGKSTDVASPSQAVQVLGLDTVPSAGDTFRVYPTEQAARESADEAKEIMRLQRLAEMSGANSTTLSSLATFDDDQEALQKMNLIIKTDSSGTLEAVKGALLMLPQDSVSLRFLHAASGEVTQSDIDLARTSGGAIIGFNVAISEDVRAVAKSKGVTINTYNVIYDLLDDVRSEMEGKIKAVEEKVSVGKAEVKALFGKGSSLVAGCVVTEGKLQKSSVVEVKRNRKRLVFEGPLSSLRRVKDDVEMVEEGTECGVGVEVCSCYCFS